MNNKQINLQSSKKTSSSTPSTAFEQTSPPQLNLQSPSQTNLSSATLLHFDPQLKSSIRTPSFLKDQNLPLSQQAKERELRQYQQQPTESLITPEQFDKKGSMTARDNLTTQLQHSSSNIKKDPPSEMKHQNYHRRNLSHQQQQVIVNNSLKFAPGTLKIVYDINETEQIEFLAGQTNNEESSSFHLSHRPFQVNKSLLIDDNEASFKTDGEFILVNRNDSDIIMKLLDKNGISNAKVIKIIDESSNEHQTVFQNQNMNSNDPDITFRDINQSSIIVNHPSQDNQTYKAQISSLNDQYNPQFTESSNQQYQQQQTLGATGTHQIPVIRENILSGSGRLTTVNPQQLKSSIVSKTQSSLIRISSRYINQEFSEEELFLAEDEFFNQLSKGIKIVYCLQKYIWKQKIMAFNKMKSDYNLIRVQKINRLVQIIDNKQIKNKIEALINIKFQKEIRQVQQKLAFERRQQLYTQSQHPKMIFPLAHQKSKKHITQKTFDEDVSEVMEENIRESDLDIIDKNSKVSVMHSSNQLAQKISEQYQYLATHSKYMNTSDFNTSASHHQRIHSMNNYAFTKGAFNPKQLFNQVTQSIYDDESQNGLANIGIKNRASQPVRSITPATMEFDNPNNNARDSYIDATKHTMSGMGIIEYQNSLTSHIPVSEQTNLKILKRLINRKTKQTLQQAFWNMFKNSKSTVSSKLKQATSKERKEAYSDKTQVKLNSPKSTKNTLVIRHQSPPLSRETNLTSGMTKSMMSSTYSKNGLDPSKSSASSINSSFLKSNIKISSKNITQSDKVNQQISLLAAGGGSKSSTVNHTRNQSKNLSHSKTTNNQQQNEKVKITSNAMKKGKDPKQCICKIEIDVKTGGIKKEGGI